MIARWAFIASGLILVASLAFVVPRWNQPTQVGPGMLFMASFGMMWLTLVSTPLFGLSWGFYRGWPRTSDALLMLGVGVALVLPAMAGLWWLWWRYRG